MEFDQVQKTLRAAHEGRQARSLEIPGFRRAAILIPVLRRPRGATVLLTRRADSLTQHRGQISFPGGGVEPQEALHEAALREAFEEVALPPDSVELIGRLDDFPSVSSYTVTPFVGLIETPPETFTVQEREVSLAFEAELAHALDASRRRVERWGLERLPESAPRQKILEAHRTLGHLGPDEETYPAYFFDISPSGGPVWGLTARILEEFLEPLREAE
jgi:8-oxo-dGTP pyrophosphatase MutT (NUDIX family)